MRYITHRCGGSLAQCDLIHLTFTEAAEVARSEWTIAVVHGVLHDLTVKQTDEVTFCRSVAGLRRCCLIKRPVAAVASMRAVFAHRASHRCFPKDECKLNDLA